MARVNRIVSKSLDESVLIPVEVDVDVVTSPVVLFVLTLVVFPAISVVVVVVTSPSVLVEVTVI